MESEELMMEELEPRRIKDGGIDAGRDRAGTSCRGDRARTSC